MNTLYFITGNENKLREARSFVPSIKKLNLDLAEIQSIEPEEIIKHKLDEAKKKHSGNFIVEDTSLIVPSLNGLPGPLIKWFEKTVGLDGIVKIVNSHGDNKAVVRCLIGLSFDNEIEFFEGKIKGKIVNPKGDNGFGWDKIFQPDDYDKTFAEMTQEEKNAISHRNLAFSKLKEYFDNKKF